jgi:hypothetical protein
MTTAMRSRTIDRTSNGGSEYTYTIRETGEVVGHVFKIGDTYSVLLSDKTTTPTDSLRSANAIVAQWNAKLTDEINRTIHQALQLTWTLTILTNEGGQWQVEWTDALARVIGKTDWCQSSSAALQQMGTRQAAWLANTLHETSMVAD